MPKSRPNWDSIESVKLPWPLSARNCRRLHLLGKQHFKHTPLLPLFSPSFPASSLCLLDVEAGRAQWLTDPLFLCLVGRVWFWTQSEEYSAAPAIRVSGLSAHIPRPPLDGNLQFAVLSYLPSIYRSVVGGQWHDLEQQTQALGVRSDATGRACLLETC